MEKVIQIMPCNAEIYAMYDYKKDHDEMSSTKARDVLGFALCEDGCIYPLVFDEEMGVRLEEGSGNSFMGFEIFRHEKKK